MVVMANFLRRRLDVECIGQVGKDTTFNKQTTACFLIAQWCRHQVQRYSTIKNLWYGFTNSLLLLTYQSMDSVINSVRQLSINFQFAHPLVVRTATALALDCLMLVLLSTQGLAPWDALALHTLDTFVSVCSSLLSVHSPKQHEASSIKSQTYCYPSTLVLCSQSELRFPSSSTSKAQVASTPPSFHKNSA